MTNDGCLPQAPDMEAGIATVSVKADRTVEVTLTPNPMTHLVKFDARIQGADIAAIRSIETRLYGVSATSPLIPGYTAQRTRRQHASSPYCRHQFRYR